MTAETNEIWFGYAGHSPNFSPIVPMSFVIPAVWPGY